MVLENNITIDRTFQPFRKSGMKTDTEFVGLEKPPQKLVIL